MAFKLSVPIEVCSSFCCKVKGKQGKYKRNHHMPLKIQFLEISFFVILIV